MPLRPRIDVGAVIRLSADSDSDREARLLSLTIAASSLRQYRSSVSVLRTYVTRLGAPVLTRELFIRFLDGLQRAGRGGVDTPLAILSALRFLQRTERLWLDAAGRCWAFDPTLDEFARGVAYNGKCSRRSVTGTITDDMFVSLVDFLQNTDGYARFVPPVAVAHAASLRISQVASLRCNCLLQDGNQACLIVLKDKRVRSTSQRGETHIKCISEDGARLIRALRADRADDDWLFHPREWQYKHLLAALKHAASMLRWPTELEWVFHSTRHGGATAVKKRIQEAALSAELQMSTAMTVRYTRSIVERVVRARAAAAPRKQKCTPPKR